MADAGWYAGSGDYPQVVELLLQAGAKRPSVIGRFLNAVDDEHVD